VPPDSIVAITFTDKAADAIKRRVARVLVNTGQSANLIGQMYIGTIHGFCQYVLQESDALYRQFDVLDDNRFTLFLMSRGWGLNLTALRGRFNGGWFRTLAEVRRAWSLARDEGVDFGAIGAIDRPVADCLEAIEAALRRDQFIDFSSMIRVVANGVVQRGAIQQRLARVQHLFIDEYQDVSGAQEEVIRGIHALGANIFVVGDDDQSIYGWRGAQVANILDFAQRFPNCGQHVLAVNFRSTRAIVQVSDQFARQELGAQRLPKVPQAHADRSPRHLGVFFFGDRADEAQAVVRRIQQLLGTEFEERNGARRGLTPADFAILMRSTKSSEQDGAPRHAAFTRELAAHGIPYTLAKGGSVFDRLEVACLRDVFELLSNGNPARNDALQLYQQRIAPEFPAADQNRLFAVLADWGRRIHAPAGGVRQRLFPQALLVDLLDAFGIARVPPAPEVMRDIGVFSRMLQDVETVYLSVDSTERFRSVAHFLRYVAEQGYDVSTEDFSRPDAVTISTVHQVKGLEFPVVFVVDVEPGRFPSNSSAYSGLVPAQLLQGQLQNGAYQGTREAEARLFYTALTRAERYLYVSGARSLPGGRRQNRPSAFDLRLADQDLTRTVGDQPANLLPAVPRARVDEATLPTSFSDVRYYLRCPMDYRFRKEYGFSPPVPELFGYGRVVHVAIEKLHELFPNVAPTGQDAVAVVRENFHLKHVAPSGDPANRPGAYESALRKAEEVATDYVNNFAQDFSHRRAVEIRFEIPAQGCLITGSIDLMMRVGEEGQIVEAQVIDFKTMEGGPNPALNADLDWTELSLQVQLYAKAAREVLGENAATGSIHLLKDNQRVNIPIDHGAVESAIQNIEWAVNGILRRDFPMRPHPEKCAACDFQRICPKRAQDFQRGIAPPPPIVTPAGPLMVSSFRSFAY
jgi:DNA helicase-2/ATP-dependent DNA helicase PcrA